MDIHLKNPDDSLLHHRLISHVIPGLTIGVNEDGTEVTISYRKSHFSYWPEIGPSLSVILTAAHLAIYSLVPLTEDFYHPGFFKALQVSLSPSCINKRWSVTDDQVTCNVIIPHVGDKSYMQDNRVSLAGVYMGSMRKLYVAVDPVTRKSRQLEITWKERQQQHIRARGWSKPSMRLPVLDEAVSPPLYTFTMTITPLCVDHNQHTNYKIYIFGAIVCVQNALAERKLQSFKGSRDVVVTDMVVVFQSESREGDMLQFKLFPTASLEDYIVACYLGDQVLSYGSYHLTHTDKAQL